jgi:phosphopantothenoylcysteine decarboxylase/phosphopantothenate--cysteine ligase
MHPSRELYCKKSTKLKGKRIVLGVTGSIAAVETVKLIRELIRHGAEIYPVMSGAAQKIIHPYSLEFASGNAPVTEITGRVEHVGLCGEVPDKADMLLVAPSTANTISKIAYGIDDTPVTTFATTAIGSKIPVIIVPAMHISMYNHPVVLENIEKLRKIGITVIKPRIAENKAKMQGIDEIVENVIRALGKKDLEKKKILVIAGSTAEEIDDIRVITNKSTGKTGVELVLSAYERGAEVELWMGRCQVLMPEYIPIKRFESTDELFQMVEDIDHDIVILPAAISDFKVEKQKGKISSDSAPTLKMIKNPKIIEKIQEKSDGFLVGFKAEYGITKDELISRATKRMAELKLPLIVANDLTKTAQDENVVYIIGKDKKYDEVNGRKEKIANRILDEVVNLC